MASLKEKEDIIQFLRKRDYLFLKELGAGACAKTVLLNDVQIDTQFVCKKFSPAEGLDRKELYSKFVEEIKILYLMYHENVVRVFNHYLYPDQQTGYILMEHVNGCDIETYLNENPERINEVFLQTISGFSYLEANNILHRDIRPQNILVTTDGTVKIIDFGFGKRILEPQDFDKSVSLNWWCDPPSEFRDGVYDFTTEVYFVGKLFEAIIEENVIDQFKYKPLLGRMCRREPSLRAEGFIALEDKILTDQFYELNFSQYELTSYRQFSEAVFALFSKIDKGAKYVENERIIKLLENAYRDFMLEEFVPHTPTVLNCLVKGPLRYYPSRSLRVEMVGAFLRLLKSSPPEKQRIILSNLRTKLDAVERYDVNDELSESDIPF